MLRPAVEKKTHTIFIVDGHPVARIGLKALFNTHDDIRVCGTANDTQYALRNISRLRPDIVLTEIVFGTGDGIELIGRICAGFPEICVVVLSCFDDFFYLRKALEAGAKGYIPKSATLEEIVTAVRRILNGGHSLKTSHTC